MSSNHSEVDVHDPALSYGKTSRGTAPGRARPWVLLGVWFGAALLLALFPDPRRGYGAYLLAIGAASAVWLAVRPGGRLVLPARAAVVCALAVRALALFALPSFSTDIFRYIYEGRLVWVLGPGFAFRFAPSAAEQLAVPLALLDDAYRQINHPDVPTIYPPLAQATFALAALLAESTAATQVVLKLILVAAELGAWLCIARVRKESAIWLLLCPLPIVEIAREGHVDAWCLFGFAVFCAAFARGGRTGYLGLSLAALCKLNGLFLAPLALRSSRRGLGLGLISLSLLSLPVVWSQRAAFAGFTRYAESWRSNDGVFALLHALVGRLLGRDWARIGTLTLTQDQLARGLALLLFLGATAWIARRPYTEKLIPGRAGLALLVLLLLSPTVHAWYVLWLLPFLPWLETGRRAALALVVLAPLAHASAHFAAAEGVWRDSSWLRLALHAPVWVLLIVDLTRRSE